MHFLCAISPSSCLIHSPPSYSYLCSILRYMQLINAIFWVHRDAGGVFADRYGFYARTWNELHFILFIFITCKWHVKQSSVGPCMPRMVKKMMTWRYGKGAHESCTTSILVLWIHKCVCVLIIGSSMQVTETQERPYFVGKHTRINFYSLVNNDLHTIHLFLWRNESVF